MSDNGAATAEEQVEVLQRGVEIAQQLNPDDELASMCAKQLIQLDSMYFAFQQEMYETLSREEDPIVLGLDREGRKVYMLDLDDGEGTTPDGKKCKTHGQRMRKNREGRAYIVENTRTAVLVLALKKIADKEVTMEKIRAAAR